MRYTNRRLSTPKISAASTTRRGVLAGGAALALTGCASSGTTSVSAPASANFVEVEGNRIHYRTLGRSGPPVIALHGASGNLRDWAIGPAQQLARTNRVILFDRPGLGLSERPRNGSSIFAQARLLQKAAAQLGVPRAHIVGHSFGGSVALAWAVEMPQTVSGLMLLSAPSQVWEGGVGFIYGFTGNSVLGPIASAVIPTLASDKFIRDSVARVFAPQAPPAGYLENVGVELALRPSSIRNNGADVSALKGHIRTMVPRYGNLRMPVEIIHGTADKSVGAQIHSDLLARQIPGARYQRLDGIGHMPHHVAPAAMLSALRRLNAG